MKKKNSSKKTSIRKAVIPVAGRGNRVMPFTLHQPKALIGIVDRPILHYVIDEAVAGGAEHIILVISPYQRASIKKYLDLLQADPEWKRITFSITVQKEPLGNGHAILSARKLVGVEPFFVLWSDDILAPLSKTEPPMLTMAKLFERVREPIITLEKVPRKDVHRYGVVKAKKLPDTQSFYEITNIVEKPTVDKAPSNLTITGRYVVTPQIMKSLKVLVDEKRFFRGEIWLADALKLHLTHGEKVYGWQYPHKRFDCGSKLGIVKAQAYFALHHKDFKAQFRTYLKDIHR